MKRVYYVSQFSRPLTVEDLEGIQESSRRNNERMGITGFLVCLGDAFFQFLEGPVESVDRLYQEHIAPDPRHTDVRILKVQTEVEERLFPGWHMKAFNLNEQAESLPFAFRELLTALVESHQTIAQYTQTGVLEMLEKGINPASVSPRRTRVTVLYSDIIGFSRFAENLDASDLIDLVNSHIDVCSRAVATHHGQVNKLTGDGVLAYFKGDTSDNAVLASEEILREMTERREAADPKSPQRYLFGGIGVAHGLVYEGNVGTDLKRDFTILGNTVNLAARIESLTRDLDVRINLDESVIENAQEPHRFRSMGSHSLKGQSKDIHLYTLDSFPPLSISGVYQQIEEFVTA